MHWDGWWHMGWMWIFWIVVAVVLVVLIRWAIVSSSDSRRSTPTPEEVLKGRYARGEIGAEEYERRLRDLRR